MYTRLALFATQNANITKYSILDILTTQFRQLNLKDEKKGNVLPSNYNYCSLFLKKLTIVVRHFAFLVILGVLCELLRSSSKLLGNARIHSNPLIPPSPCSVCKA